MTLDSLKDIVSKLEKEMQDSGHLALIVNIEYSYYCTMITIEYVDRNTHERHTIYHDVPSNAYNL